MTIEAILILIIIAIISLVLIVFILINNKNEKIILEKSQMIKSLLELNNTIHFSKIKYKYTYQQSCKSKRQLDKFSMDDYLLTIIDSDEENFRSIVEAITSNISTYDNYIKQIENIKSSATEEFCQAFGFTLTKFLKYEAKVFKKKTLCKPQTDIVINCKATYTSPQGKNHYWKEQCYHYSELKKIYDNIIELKTQKQMQQYYIILERAKMTSSLRYDILKRDNFRCQICGSCAKDGVKLHVDHIIPVSKGGQTIASNLRTLCDRCNMGKSDKYDIESQ